MNKLGAVLASVVLLGGSAQAEEPRRSPPDPGTLAASPLVSELNCWTIRGVFTCGKPVSPVLVVEEHRATGRGWWLPAPERGDGLGTAVAVGRPPERASVALALPISLAVELVSGESPVRLTSPSAGGP